MAALSIVLFEVTEDGSGVNAKVLGGLGSVPIVTLENLIDVSFLEFVFSLIERGDGSLVILR